ncbi:MAG: hypothetical protein IT294_16760 [Deltaproteobacteria bacterium]|nr:hypothetical protein [Deltaproteobacteria bacterium]
MQRLVRYVAAAGAAVLLGASPAAAQPVGPTDLQPAAVLVMPFDVTAEHSSFLLVSRIGDTAARRAVTTHWVFYSADCGHLADLAIGLTENDTVVVDPTRIQSQTQEPGSPVNESAGPIVDLTGARGVAIVTVQAPPDVSPVQLIGSWTIADRAAGSAFGANAVGFTGFALPDPSVLASEGLVIPTFAPSALDTSQVIVVGLERQGDAIAPIARPSAALGGARVCCNAQVTDTLEAIVSVPDVCFACALFAPVAPTRLPSADPPVVPLAAAPASAGMVVLRACRTAGGDGVPVPLGTGGSGQFLVAFHGQAVGPFGVVTAGKSGALPLAPP